MIMVNKEGLHVVQTAKELKHPTISLSYKSREPTPEKERV
jgi:hypothetical protein